ncbi:MAG: YfhO family protein [Bacteroidota bacterium]|nr:YfhO family protein [Bacteroidota bacterium]
MKKHPHAVFISLIALLLIVFFHEAFFGGKVFNTPDNISSIQYEQGYLEQAKKSGENAFWNPYIFCGMPTWGSSSPGHGMYLHTFLDPLKPLLLMQIYGWVQAIIGILPLPDVFWNVFNYFLLGLFTYLFALRKKFEPMTAFIAAVSVVFSLYSLNWIMAGHNTKITVFAWLPALLLLVDMLFEKKSLLTAALLIAALHMTFNSGHVQMIFYDMMVVFLYILYKLYEGEKIGNTAIVAAITVGAALFAFLMLSGPYFATWEYKDYSIRGMGSGGSGHAPAGGGLDYEYATNWSFSPIEVFTFFIPSFVGFGNLSYWGTMPFTESPIYLGAVACFLALLGILLRPKDRFVHFWVFLGLLALLVSFGRNFSLVYDLFFRYMPFFNNFRIPSMILYLNALCVGMLAAVGIGELVRRAKAVTRATEGVTKKKLAKKIWVPVAAFAAFTVFLFLFGGSMKQMIADSMQKHQPMSWNVVRQVEEAAQAGRLSDVPPEYRSLTRDGIYNMAMNDALLALVLVALAGGLCWLYARGRISPTVLHGGLFVLLLVDMWIVDYKPMRMEPKRAQQQTLQESDVVQLLRQDKGLYRILPINHGTDNYYVAFGIQSVAGYHPAKLKYYDDIRNKVFGEFRFQSADQVNRANWALLSMLNVKYVVVPNSIELSVPWLRRSFQGASESIYENTLVLPRAFFVGSYEVVGSDSLLLQKVGMSPAYAPDRIAYLSAPPPRMVAPVPDSLIARSRATIVTYGINGMTIEAETPADAILKLSESYYPSGWKATIDGEEVPILRTDYAFRALVVPAGRHRIELSFEPRSYRVGLAVTVATNYLLAAVLLVYAASWAFRYWRKRPARRGAV